MKYGYGWEKLFSAMLGLATGNEPIQQRLVNATAYALIHIRPEDDLPETSRDRFQNLLRELTEVEAKGDEGRIAATINKLSDDDASHYAKEILSIYDDTTKAYALSQAE